MGKIYVVINKVNNKSYVGQTINNLKERYCNNVFKYTHNSHLKNSFVKYGENNFVTVEMECPDELLNEREIDFIELFDSFNNGYNKTLGGQEGNRKYLTDEEKIVGTVKNYCKGNSDLESYLMIRIWDRYIKCFDRWEGNLTTFLSVNIRGFAKNFEKSPNNTWRNTELYGLWNKFGSL